MRTMGAIKKARAKTARAMSKYYCDVMTSNRNKWPSSAINIQ